MLREGTGAVDVYIIDGECGSRFGCVETDRKVTRAVSATLVVSIPLG
jgi:hypothetical protein